MSIRIEAVDVLCQGDTEQADGCDVRVTRSDDFCEHRLHVSSNKVVWKKGTSSAAAVQKVFTSEHKIEQVFWCHFEQGSREELVRWLCIVDTDAIILHSVEGAVYNVSVPFKVCKVWPIKGGLLVERKVTGGMQSSDPSQDGDGLPVLFTLTHPLEDICPVTSRQMHCSSTCVNYLYEPHMKVMATFEDPSLIVTFDATSRSHAVWLLRKAETEDIPLQPPAVCRDVSVLHLKGTPKVMSSSAPEKFPLNVLSGKATPILTPVQRLLFKTPDVFGSVQHLGGGQRGRQEKATPSHPLSLARGPPDAAGPSAQRDPFADFLESGNRVPQRPEGAVRIGSGQTPMRMRHKPRIPQEEMDQSVLTARKAKSFSPIRSSPMVPHYSRSWSTVFCDPLVCDETILESMGEPLLPEKCIELVWAEDPNNSALFCTGCASNIFLTRDINGKTYIVFIEEELGEMRLVEYRVESETKIEVAGSSFPLSATRALSLDALNMMAVVMSDDSLHLYSGFAKVAGLHMDMGDFPGKGGRPSVVRLQDAVGHKFTMVFSNGLSVRCQVPPLSSSPLVLLCLQALQACLPPETALQATLSCYRWRALQPCDRSCDEWAVFVQWLLSALGVQQQGDAAEDHSVQQQVLQALPALRLLENHAGVLDKVDQCMQRRLEPPPVQVPWVSELQLVAADVVCILHLVFEEVKLHTASEEDAGRLVSLLYNLTKCYNWPCHVDAYFRYAPDMCLHRGIWSSSNPVDSPGEPPLLTDWLKRLAQGEEVQSFPVIFGVTERTALVVQLFALLVSSPSKGLSLPLVAAPLGGNTASSAESIQRTAAVFEQAQSPASSSPAERVVKLLSQAGHSSTLLHTFPFGVSLPLWHCVYKCQQNPSSHWTPEMYHVVGREDIAQSLNVGNVDYSGKPPLVSVHSSSAYPEMDMEDEVVRLVFREDLRLEELRRCLQSSKPVRVALTQRPEVSDHQFLEEQEGHLLLISQRTMALPVGRGMFTLGTVQPLPATPFPIPQLNLTGRAPPKNTTISFDRITVPEGMSTWPSFHNGVAAGLRITPNLSKLDASWVLANLTEQLQASPTEGGFFMGLGLNGHLDSLPNIALCNLFSQRNEMCTLGIFLGMSAARCGSCDSHLTSLVALHIRSLLPPGAADMDIPHSIEIACLVSLGLLHMASGSRHLVDVMLKEIACLPGPEMENAVDRESHSLAAGLCLGMILLAKGNRSPGISDLDLVEKLVVYISGDPQLSASTKVAVESHKQKFANQLILECSYVNTHVTAPGAILALGLAFLKTNDKDAAKRIAVPETYTGLLNVRPDFLLLKVLSYSLIMWESVETGREWVESWLPKVVSKWAFNTQKTSEHNIDIQGISQAEVNIIAGACLSMGMRFAGTAHKEAFDTLLHYTNYLLSRLESSAAVGVAGQPCLERCLNVALLSTAMVMSGTGNLEVFRLVRQLRVQVASGDVTYGNHMVVHMALGLLFLSGCTRALDTSNKAVAAMVAAFYPLFPATSSDNRYHLQALRHLYVMATSPRLLLARNIHTNRACSVPVKITTEVDGGEVSVAEVVIPLVGPRWSTIRKIEVVGERYWNFALEVTDRMRECLSRAGVIFVKERVGYFSYEDDPGGQQSSLSRALLSGYHDHDSFFTVRQGVVNIAELTRNPFAKTFARLNCSVAKETSEHDSSWRSYLTAALTECVLTEKLHLLPVYIQLEKMCQDLAKGMARPKDISQFVLAAAFAASFSKEGNEMILSKRFFSLQEFKMKSQLDQFETALSSQDTGSAGGVTIDLASLLRGYIFRTSPSPCNKTESVLLVCLLILYSIPSPHELQLMPEGSPQDLFIRLQALRLSSSALLKLLALVNMDPLQFLSPC